MKPLLFIFLLATSIPAQWPDTHHREWHVGISFTITTGTYLALTGHQTYQKFLFSGLVATGMGLSKEVYDHYTGGVMDSLDIVDNWLGTSLALFLMLILDKDFRHAQK